MNAQRRARFQSARDGTGEGHLQTVEDPGDAERRDHQDVKTPPRQAFEPRRDQRFDHVRPQGALGPGFAETAWDESSGPVRPPCGMGVAPSRTFNGDESDNAFPRLAVPATAAIWPEMKTESGRKPAGRQNELREIQIRSLRERPAGAIMTRRPGKGFCLVIRLSPWVG